MHICCTCSRKIFQQRGGCKRDIARIQKIHYDRVCTYHFEGVEERQPFQNPILTIQDCSADGNPLGPPDPSKASVTKESIGCAPLSDDAQPIHFPRAYRASTHTLIVGTGFQNARFRIQNHFFCLGGRPIL